MTFIFTISNLSTLTITAKSTFTIMTMRIMTMKTGITITNATVTEPVKKFSQFVFTQASQETCSCAA